MSDNDNAVKRATRIKIAMLKLGLSQANIAKELNLTRQTVNKVINGKGVSKKVDNYIISLLKLNKEKP